MRVRRTGTVPVLVLIAGAVAIAAITALQNRSDESRRAQAQLAQVAAHLGRLQVAPFAIVVAAKPAAIRARMQALESSARADVDRLRATDSVPALANVDAQLDAVARAEEAELGVLQLFLTAHGRSEMAAAFMAPEGSPLSRLVTAPLQRAQRANATVVATLDAAGRQYDARASRAKTQSLAGSIAAIVLLVLAFAYANRRARRARTEAERLAAENASLAAASRHEAITDALTGLGNRRALIEALEAGLADGGAHRRLALALFDLDGFKQYNDSFGHPSGDELLARLGGRLAGAVAGIGTAFRMGGDEFCVLAPAGDGGEQLLARRAADALTDTAEGGCSIGCSYGVAVVPDEASSVEEALRLADQRMYAQKAGKLRAA
ncbi:MAG TPA: GGDEF domain-containing protein [Gaiellaceae bacterium]|jgi:diguanylate cyclase (GGDEF)-like protein|nr:GGDEF domain-containing protein [Gaiellaceae bacterium]